MSTPISIKSWSTFNIIVLTHKQKIQKSSKLQKMSAERKYPEAVNDYEEAVDNYEWAVWRAIRLGELQEVIEQSPPGLSTDRVEIPDSDAANYEALGISRTRSPEEIKTGELIEDIFEHQIEIADGEVEKALAKVLKIREQRRLIYPPESLDYDDYDDQKYSRPQIPRTPERKTAEIARPSKLDSLAMEFIEKYNITPDNFYYFYGYFLKISPHEYVDRLFKRIEYILAGKEEFWWPENYEETYQPSLDTPFTHPDEQ